MGHRKASALETIFEVKYILHCNLYFRIANFVYNIYKQTFNLLEIVLQLMKACLYYLLQIDYKHKTII